MPAVCLLMHILPNYHVRMCMWAAFMCAYMYSILASMYIAHGVDILREHMSSQITNSYKGKSQELINN